MRRFCTATYPVAAEETIKPATKFKSVISTLPERASSGEAASSDTGSSVFPVLPTETIRACLYLVRCHHRGKPAWAQNDAMIAAYLDGADYFYRINDDTELITSNWTNIFIDTLAAYDPPNVGVVGPTHGGSKHLNMEILTYDFVHRTHLDIFGFYYPRLFTDWFADDWITDVYEPSRTRKLSMVHLRHTVALGRRYEVRDSSLRGCGVQERVYRDRITLKKFLFHPRSAPNDAAGQLLLLSLSGRHAGYAWTAVRSAQLVPLYLPGWRLRVLYTPLAVTTSHLTGVVSTTLRRLAADLIPVNASSDPVLPCPDGWRSRAFVNNQLVDEFLARHAAKALDNAVDLALLSDFWRHSSTQQSELAVGCVNVAGDRRQQAGPELLWNRQQVTQVLEEFYGSVDDDRAALFRLLGIDTRPVSGDPTDHFEYILR